MKLRWQRQNDAINVWTREQFIDGNARNIELGREAFRLFCP
jgi:hypothetical protein